MIRSVLSLRPRVALLLVLASSAGTAPAAVAQDGGTALAEARAAHRSGEYDRALERYEEATGDSGTAVEAWRGMTRVLSLTGRYAQAEETARRGSRELGGARLSNTLGEILYERGRLEEAEAEFRRALEEGAADSLDARLNLAILQLERGEREEAMEAFDTFIDVYNRSPNLDARDLTAVATAVQHLGRTDPALFQDALRAFDEAVEAEPDLLEPRIRTGELFLEKYNSQEARATFQEVLALNPRHPDALSGMARAMDFDNDPSALETARQALQVDPGHVDTHVFLSRAYIQLERYEDAEAEAREALATNPASLDALAALASVHHVRDDLGALQDVRARADSLYPGNATVPLTIAEVSATHRRYDEAVDFASEARRRDPRNWQALGVLGLNQLRVRDVGRGRQNLERAFEGDPYNVWFKNTLDLLDKWDEYETLDTEHFDIMVHQDEAGVLAPYIARVAEEAWDALTAQYDHEPPHPIRLEVYPSHADFSVRTVGLVGLGALGVSFGNVIVLDSPTARDAASFNWASALWHEIGHSVHMSLSRQRVPRWFSEGLAVEDQRRAVDGWGHGASVGYLQAWREDRMPPASRLNDGFMRPEFPEQVVYSYYQASLLFDYIEDQWGFDAIRQLLRGYADGSTTPELLPRVLRIEPDELDRRFEEYVSDRFRPVLDGMAAAERADDPAAGGNPAGGEPRRALERHVTTRPNDFGARMRLAALLASEGEQEGAAEQLQAALDIFPEYAGNDGPHWALARLRREQGRLQDAARHLAALRALNESHLPGAVMEAEIQEELGNPEVAARALERAIEIAPLDMEIHERLARLYAEIGRWQDAVREREAIVALAPVDISTAWYEVARARLEAGDRTGAREAVLHALERAPRFQEALELLLEIRAGERAAPGPDSVTETPDDPRR